MTVFAKNRLVILRIRQWFLQKTVIVSSRRITRQFQLETVFLYSFNLSLTRLHSFSVPIHLLKWCCFILSLEGTSFQLLNMTSFYITEYSLSHYIYIYIYWKIMTIIFPLTRSNIFTQITNFIFPNPINCLESRAFAIK